MRAPRVICQFSCGAASAVATYLTLAEYGQSHEVVILNAFVRQEHIDNRRFLADCESWFGRPVLVVRNTKYDASTIEVFRKRRFIKGRFGAPCTMELKKSVLNADLRDDDILVLGYTMEEQGRLDLFLDANSGRRVLTPLIDWKVTKAQCFEILQGAGLKLPEMYRLGYQNANCIGCVKGGAGYWNKIRRDFPEEFEEMAVVEEMIGPSAYILRNRVTNIRFPLRELPPGMGRYKDEPPPECGVLCEGAA